MDQFTNESIYAAGNSQATTSVAATFLNMLFRNLAHVYIIPKAAHYTPSVFGESGEGWWGWRGSQANYKLFTSSWLWALFLFFPP